MKYFKKGDILLSDFDGVFLNSQERFDEVMKEEKSFALWKNYLKNLDWVTFLKECQEIPGAEEIFKELIDKDILKGFLLQINSIKEGQAKANYIREKGMIIPIHYVLAPQTKSYIYPPNEHIILLDDKIINTEDWEDHGGKAILYGSKVKKKSKSQINNLSDLLK